MGVKSEFSAPREQYQNGAAERAIRTILDTARTVLAASGLSGAFWSCATQYATQVRNCTFKKHLGGVPVTLLTGTCRNFIHLDAKHFLMSMQYFGVIPKCKVEVSMAFIVEMQQHIICNVTRYGSRQKENLC